MSTMKIEKAINLLADAASGNITGGQGARAYGQFFYQDKLKNTQNVVAKAIAILREEFPL